MFFILEKEQLQLLIVVYYKWKELLDTKCTINRFWTFANYIYMHVHLIDKIGVEHQYFINSCA